MLWCHRAAAGDEPRYNRSLLLLLLLPGAFHCTLQSSLLAIDVKKRSNKIRNVTKTLKNVTKIKKTFCKRNNKRYLF